MYEEKKILQISGFFLAHFYGQVIISLSFFFFFKIILEYILAVSGKQEFKCEKALTMWRGLHHTFPSTSR
jgi:hypothetical protein